MTCPDLSGPGQAKEGLSSGCSGVKDLSVAVQEDKSFLKKQYFFYFFQEFSFFTTCMLFYLICAPYCGFAHFVPFTVGHVRLVFWCFRIVHWQSTCLLAFRSFARF